MRAFVLRSGLFVLLFLLAGIVIKSTLPFYWGNTWLKYKYPRFLYESEKVDHIFLGSSRTYRHFVPVIFDSIMAAREVPCRSFNLGIPGLFPPQSYFVLRKALEDGDIRPGATVLFELSRSVSVPEEQLATARGSYWTNAKDHLYMMRYANTCAGNDQRSDMIRSYTLAYLQNLFHLAQYTGFLNDTEYMSLPTDRTNNAGHVSLEHERTHSGKAPVRADLEARQRELQADTTIVEQQLSNVRAVRAAAPSAACEVEVANLLALHAKAESAGVQLIFFLPAIYLKSDMWATYAALPDGMKLDLNDVSQTSIQYDPGYRFDKGHLNERGALLFTARAADAYAAFLRAHGRP